MEDFNVCFFVRIYFLSMIEFIKDNAQWLTPILVAVCGGIVSGIFYLMKKGGSQQHIENVGNENSINQVNGNNNTIINGTK